MTRILLISGDTREGSLHTAALRTAVRYAPASIAVSLYDGLRTLPAFVPGEPVPPAAVALLRHRAGAADAVLVSTPEYAGSLPGSLKNLFDWLVDSGELQGKPAAWLSLCPPTQDQAALATLETVLAHARARLLKPACIRLPLGPRAVDGGVVTDPRMQTVLQDMLRALERVIALPEPRQAPSWQVHSSLFPVVPRRNRSGFDPGRIDT
ncbi:NADPH-dependent FMN reductase [Couchioplanes caeruleus]|uniref:NADPH-dependent FMN reductase n=2 Tax=Couchioplanes caeruleus TaxID=56438 RepID=A0A1K0FT23_9ACTN|nr:NADPH-dependent FMN reductase [Couchioplanes caeruleus]OJF16007.1 NADPH-dependent FMN reductase [Couchioplanes caeruleus subsp. caeruleus]ROP27865.1 NAD(P)H-dependent FMN reductase [Couchioplanes caeruleus]